MMTDHSVNVVEGHKMTGMCWTAVITGALVGLGIGFLLNLFGAAIGLSAYKMNQSEAVVAIGGVIGLLIGVIVAMGASGFVAGYLGRFHHCYCHGGVIYGFVTWCLALILSTVLVIPMIHYVGFYADNINSALIASELSNANANPVTKAPTNGNVAPTPANPTGTKGQVSAPSQPIKYPAWTSWILFILFFVGALSSCIGACYGMRSKGCHAVNS
ncbi:MAG: hypothetical protein P4L79_06760 [Legionella sp.]|uniref:hypothetical protein n=1 Tax=Legionella sp. TaxID=459 RepID=UPI002847C545|nr:hypothetical protein [Legionella sp.]